MDNLEIAQIFSHIADILELKDENPFRIRTYRRTALVLESFPHDVNQFYKEGRLRSIPGVGEGIEEKIKELIETGRLRYYEDLKKEIPEGIFQILEIQEIGPKTASVLYKKLGIDNIKKLKKAAVEHKIRELPGMGEKTEENILKGIDLLKKRKERIPLQEALVLADKISQPLEKLKEVKRMPPP